MEKTWKIFLSTKIIVSMLALLFQTSAARAAGFFLSQQTVQGVGRAFAGGSAIAADASTIFTNPAGMTELEGREAMLGASILFPRISFRNTGSTAATTGSLGARVIYGGNDGGNPFDPKVIPNLYAAYPFLRGRLWIGIGVSSPFGLDLEYDEGWFGRYDAIRSTLTTVNVAPSAAFKITDALAVGGGIDVQRADAILTNAIPNTLLAGGPTAATDGINRLEGDDWSVGFNIGVLVKPLPATRVGLHFRSAIRHELTGENRVSNLTDALAPVNGAFRAKADLNLPDIVSLGLAYEATPQATLLAEVQWFNWSRFDEVRVRFANGSRDLVVPQDYADSYAASVGAEYQWTEAWTVRAGFRYETTPTVDDFRTTSVPEGDNYSLGVGATYKVAERCELDVSYFHTFWEDGKVDLTRQFFESTAASGRINIKGKAETRSDTLALNLRYRF